MSYLGNNYLKELIIGGGLQTAEHKKSGGYRLDLVHTPGLNRAWWDYELILEAPNGDGTNYAVFRLVGTNYYLFAVHIRNARSAKRGEIAFDLVPSKFLHVHIKIGGYASTITKYLKYLEHLDPSIKISTNYGSNAYTGLNKGVHLPISNSNQPPMGTFSYDLYLKGSDMYMRVTSGSINENVTVKNITKGTSWTVFCNKSVGNDGGPINTGMLEALYEVTAKGVTKQLDNRPDPCAGVKTELANANKVIASKDSEIAKLNASLGGMTTDRNKYATMVEDLNKRFNEQAEIHEKSIAELNLKYSTQEQQLINCEDDRGPLLKRVEDLEGKLITANAELDKAAKIISKLIQDNKGTNINWGSYINKLIRAIKSFIARNVRSNL